MNEEHIRALVREALARHLEVPRDGAGRDGSPSRPSPLPGQLASPALSLKSTLAFGRFVSLAPTDPDAPCVVEPQVTCHHCGFCQSYGH